MDHYLSAYCTTTLQKLEPKVLDLLRLSAYQIVLLDKVPPRAAVNEAVALCRRGGCARASGLVNAVLRRVAEHRDALPEIRFKDPAELERLPGIQRDILAGLAPCVKPGGVLVYSTCTVLARENEDVVRNFLRAHPEISPETFSLPLPGADASDGMFTFWPQEHGTDGFFVCKLRRHE